MAGPVLHLLSFLAILALGSCNPDRSWECNCTPCKTLADGTYFLEDPLVPQIMRNLEDPPESCEMGCLYRNKQMNKILCLCDTQPDSSWEEKNYDTCSGNLAVHLKDLEKNTKIIQKNIESSVSGAVAKLNANTNFATLDRKIEWALKNVEQIQMYDPNMTWKACLMKSLATIPNNPFDSEMINKIKDFLDDFEKDLAKIADVNSQALITMIDDNIAENMDKMRLGVEDIAFCELKCYVLQAMKALYTRMAPFPEVADGGFGTINFSRAVKKIEPKGRTSFWQAWMAEKPGPQEIMDVLCWSVCGCLIEAASVIPGTRDEGPQGPGCAIGAAEYVVTRSLSQITRQASAKYGLDWSEAAMTRAQA